MIARKLVSSILASAFLAIKVIVINRESARGQIVKKRLSVKKSYFRKHVRTTLHVTLTSECRANHPNRITMCRVIYTRRPIAERN